jgi:hypothetical protein
MGIKRMSRSAPPRQDRVQDRQRRCAARGKDNIGAKLQKARTPGIRVVDIGQVERNGPSQGGKDTRAVRSARLSVEGRGLTVANKRPESHRESTATAPAPCRCLFRGDRGGSGARPTIDASSPRPCPSPFLPSAMERISCVASSEPPPRRFSPRPARKSGMISCPGLQCHVLDGLRCVARLCPVGFLVPWCLTAHAAAARSLDSSGGSGS